MNKGHDKGHKGHKVQMSDREAMRIALEALEFFDNNVSNPAEKFITSKAITALRQALKQPEQPQFFYGQDPNVLPVHDKGESRE